VTATFADTFRKHFGSLGQTTETSAYEAAVSGMEAVMSDYLAMFFALLVYGSLFYFMWSMQ
jgi:hypothetical protein